MKKRLLFLLIIIVILLLPLWIKQYYQSKSKFAVFPEIQQLEGENLSFDELKKYFTALANSKGAKYAYEVLKNAPVPPNTDMHLLGHVVGDVLYKQQGADGIQICTEDFRNACSHSIVVGLFTNIGEAALAEIAKACQKAPGGLGAYIMCYHGLGHGILAYTGYDFSQTLKYCQKTGTKNHNNQEYPECVSGAVMEIISGGGHDHDLWLKQRPKYLKLDNPFYLCSPDFMPEEGRGRCYDYLTPYLWEAVGADPNHPTEDDFIKSFHLCDQISEDDLRLTCYGGFGKEFVGLSQNKDIRRIDQMDDKSLGKVVNWCKLAPNSQAIRACLKSALSSLYWGGENDVAASIRFCHIIPDAKDQKACFLYLIDQASFYVKDSEYRKSFCKKLPAGLSADCQKSLTLANSCRGLASLGNKQQCWEKLIEDTLNNHGLDAAFGIVDSLYNTETSFASDCHDYTHLLGEKAYQLFAQSQKINLSTKTSFCGFGFYHAFMEKLLRDSSDYVQARKFCREFVPKSGQSELSTLSCFHGIGHGLLEDIPNPQLKEDAQAIIATPLAVCEKVGETLEEKKRCSSGIFNVMAIYYANPQSGLKADDNNPYAICKSQANDYFKEPCFDQMNTYVLFKLAKGDLLNAAKFAEEIGEDLGANAAMHGLAGAYGQSNVSKVSYDEVVRLCKNIQPRLKSICLEGFVMGLIEGGQPGSEQTEAFKFCANGLLIAEEKNLCFNLLTWYLKSNEQT